MKIVFITPMTALWLNIQNQYDLDELKASGKVVQISEIRPAHRMKG